MQRERATTVPNAQFGEPMLICKLYSWMLVLVALVNEERVTGIGRGKREESGKSRAQIVAVVVGKAKMKDGR